MAQSYVTDDGVVLYEPGSVVSTKIIAGQGGIATAGVVTLIGESDEGPHWSQEEDLDLNVFGPDEIAEVTRKYGSGRLVDAFRAIVAASADAAIVGSVSAIKLVKTNDSAEATSLLSRPGFGNYAILAARVEGASGNLIKYKIEISQQEVAPTTGSIVYTPSSAPITFKLRNNGKDQKTITAYAFMSAPDLIAAIQDMPKGILANGGDREDPLTGLAGINLTATAPSANQLVVTLASGNIFPSSPEVGDTVVIPAIGHYGAISLSVIAGAGSANVGSYVVTSVSNTLTSASLTLKSINITGIATVAASGAISAGVDDIIVFKPLVISNLTGMDRQVALGLTPSWSTTLNDGTNAVLEITSSESWIAQPQFGDTFKLSATFAGITAGFYFVTGSTSKTVSVTRLSSGTSGSTGTAVSVAAGFIVEKPSIDGLGKTMEVDGSVAAIFKTSAGAAVSFSNSMLYSAAESSSLTTVSKGNTEDTFEAGGEVIIQIGTTKVDAKVVIGSAGLTFSEGVTTLFTASFEQYKTMKDLSDFIGSQTDFVSSIASSRFSNSNPSTLDKGTYYLSSAGWKPGRIKADANAWKVAVSGSGLALPSMIATAGLPEVIAPEKFLSGGAKNGTSSLQVTQAMDAMSSVETNFIVTLFSKDASDDIAESLTDSSSAYTIDAINALVRNHVIAMSRLKAKKNRIGLISKSGAYKDQKEAASEVGNFRIGFSIQDVKTVGSSGSIQTNQPWMASVIAAGMQAAAGYKGIVKKFANVSGIIHSAGDFNVKSFIMREDALKAGLLIMEPVNTGGFRWVSDQTSHTQDNNFVLNSLQAVYISDLMALTLINSFERSIVGKSVAEVSAKAAEGFLESELFNFKRLKWIASSDDAPNGWKNPSVKIQGGVMRVSVEVKLAGLIYFIPINLSISEVTQSST